MDRESREVCDLLAVEDQGLSLRGTKSKTKGYATQRTRTSRLPRTRNSASRISASLPLYSDPAVRAAFRDIVTGGNGGFNARIGWDPCTGWGSPDGYLLREAFAPPLVHVQGIVVGQDECGVTAVTGGFCRLWIDVQVSDSPAADVAVSVAYSWSVEGATIVGSATDASLVIDIPEPTGPGQPPPVVVTVAVNVRVGTRTREIIRVFTLHPLTSLQARSSACCASTGRSAHRRSSSSPETGSGRVERDHDGGGPAPARACGGCGEPATRGRRDGVERRRAERGPWRLIASRSTGRLGRAKPSRWASPSAS